MKVILLQDVRSVGQKNDVKDVADGYAMNFLFPRRLAEGATGEKVEQLQAARAAKQKETAAEEERADEVIRSLNDAHVPIRARATEKGGLFKSLSARDIAAAVQKTHGVILPESAIALETPIKTTGEHVVKLHRNNASGVIGVIVSAQ